MFILADFIPLPGLQQMMESSKILNKKLFIPYTVLTYVYKLYVCWSAKSFGSIKPMLIVVCSLTHSLDILVTHTMIFMYRKSSTSNCREALRKMNITISTCISSHGYLWFVSSYILWKGK